jgi:hypothetical protein
MERVDTLKIAERAFAEIAARFPHLHMVKNEGVPVELDITVPIQPGLKHRVSIYLANNDELNFVVCHFWLDWFSCTNPEKVEAYIEAVSGFLSGNYRILEHYRGKKCVRAELQAPSTTGWKTISTSSTIGLTIPWKKTFNEVRNA